MAVSKNPKETLAKATKGEVDDEQWIAAQKSFHQTMLSKTYTAENWITLEPETLRNYEKQLPRSKKRD